MLKFYLKLINLNVKIPNVKKGSSFQTTNQQSRKNWLVTHVVSKTFKDFSLKVFFDIVILYVIKYNSLNKNMGETI